MLDRTLAREIKAFVGTGQTRENRVKVNQTVRKVAEELKAASRYDDSPFHKCLKEYGRAAVAISIASTLWERRDRLENWGLKWAMAVLELWQWKDAEATMRGFIGGNAHPTDICVYASSFLKLTWE